MVSDGEVFLTRPEVARRWRCSKETIIRREAQGVLRPYRLGRTVRYKLSQVLAAEAAAGGEQA